MSMQSSIGRPVPGADAPDFEYIRWNPKFELGIPVIDAQHKTLVDLCNSFYQALIQRKSDWKMPWEESLSDALHKCVEYATTHLKDEEKLMLACGYPGYAQHRQTHVVFMKEILSTTESFKDATIGTAFKFVRFLYDWILSHIAHDDKLYVPFLLDYYRKTRAGLQ